MAIILVAVCVALAIGVVVYCIQERRWYKRLRAQENRQSRYEHDVHIMRWRDLIHQYGQDVCANELEGKHLALLGQSLPYIWDAEAHDRDVALSVCGRAKEVAARYGVTLASDPKQAVMQVIDLSTCVMVGTKKLTA